MNAEDRDRDLLLRGGSVRTLDPARPEAAALVIRGDRIAAVLDDPADGPARARRIDLDGGCVLPGFTDAHVHFPSWALARGQLQLTRVRSLPEALARVAEAAAGRPRGAWLRGGGWRDELWPSEDRPDRWALDAVTAHLPVALRSQDGHSLWLNSAALAIAGEDLETPGGVVERDPAGEPTGILREEAAWRFQARFAAGSEEVLGAMKAALPAVAAAGVVALHDKDGGRGAPQHFATLRDAGELTVRVWQSLPAEGLDALMALAVDAGVPVASPRHPAAGELVRIGYVKAFMDGTLGSRTARLLDGSGIEITSSEALAEIIRRAASAGLPVAVHAIGDRANREALDAFAATEAIWRPLGLRHRIEHAQCVHADDLPRFAQLGITASVQYSHATSDQDLVERIWGARGAHSYPYRSLLDAGTRLAAGSDAPVEPLDPVAGLRAAVYRTIGDRPPWRPEQAIELTAALGSFTREPAWLERAEDSRGMLRAGLAADLIVLDRDPVADLGLARVKATMLAGRWLLAPP